MDGNIHAIEVTASAAALYLIHSLVTRHKKDETVTQALDTRAFYIVPRVNPDGAEWALADKPRKGRACKLSEAQRQALAARLDTGPRPEDGVCTLRGEDVRRIVEKEFNVMYKLSAIYPLLHRLGYSCLMPREQHPKADPQAQEAFKKTPLTR